MRERSPHVHPQNINLLTISSCLNFSSSLPKVGSGGANVRTTEREWKHLKVSKR